MMVCLQIRQDEVLANKRFDDLVEGRYELLRQRQEVRRGIRFLA